MYIHPDAPMPTSSKSLGFCAHAFKQHEPAPALSHVRSQRSATTKARAPPHERADLDSDGTIGGSQHYKINLPDLISASPVR
jgi:hypothetical protein